MMAFQNKVSLLSLHRNPPKCKITHFSSHFAKIWFNSVRLSWNFTTTTILTVHCFLEHSWGISNFYVVLAGKVPSATK